jgi:hypothetical protein
MNYAVCLIVHKLLSSLDLSTDLSRIDLVGQT